MTDTPEVSRASTETRLQRQSRIHIDGAHAESRSSQRTNELTAAEHDEVHVVMSLELGNRIGGVARQQRGVRPRERLGQGRRHNVLLGVVEHLGEGVRLRLIRPEGGEVLIGPSPEEELGATHALRHFDAHDLIVVRQRPPTVREPAPSVLVRATGAWMTPSSVTLSTAVILLMSLQPSVDGQG